MLIAPTFSDRTWNFLSEDLKAVDWLLKAEALDKEKVDALRELADTRSSRKPSNADLQVAMFELVTGMPVRSEEDRRSQLAAVVRGIEDALQHTSLARREKLARIGPALVELYRYHDRTQLAEDFAALNRPDNSKEVDAKIAALESKVEKVERKISGHRGNVLTCFRGGVLPQASDIRAINASLDMGLPPEQIGEFVVREFAKAWRQRAPLFQEPVSIHGTSIRSMTSDRREVWQEAYDKMGLGDLPKHVRYAPRIEPRSVVVLPESKGAFFSGREAVSAR